MKFIVTIDAEEDDWGVFKSTGHTVKNIGSVPQLQDLFDKYEIKPTYLINYPVATDTFSIDLFKAYHAAGKCEIGMHCHPWNTPPFGEKLNEYNSMLCNLPNNVQFEKLDFLHNVISENFGVVPVSFRAGRWGFNTDVARLLFSLGYRVETSITPYTDWSACQGPDFSMYEPYPFRFNPDSLHPQPKGGLMQVPASIGFLQNNFKLCHHLFQLFGTKFHKKHHFNGVLSRLRLLNKVWLSPEHADADLMIKFAKRLMKMNYPCLNMTFHSTSLLAGLSPFVITKQDEVNFLRRIESFLKFAVEAQLESLTLSSFESSYKENAGTVL